MLFGLVSCAAGVIEIRLATLFDMSAEDMGNRMKFDEIHHSLRARRIGGNLRITYIQAAWIETVASHQIAGEAVIERNARDIVTRNGDDIHDAVPEVDLPKTR